MFGVAEGPGLQSGTIWILYDENAMLTDEWNTQDDETGKCGEKGQPHPVKA